MELIPLQVLSGKEQEQRMVYVVVAFILYMSSSSSSRIGRVLPRVKLTPVYFKVWKQHTIPGLGPLIGARQRES